MSTYQHFIGIDVSKSVLDIAELGTSRSEPYQIQNTDTAILTWLSDLDLSQTFVVLEATGAYSQRLTCHLAKQGAFFSLVNPLRSAAYVKVLGITTKNDRQAAQTLALMAQRIDLPLYQPKEDAMLQRKQLLMGINALKKQQQMLRNQLHALEHQIIFAPKVVEALQETLRTVEANILALEEQLNQLDDAEYDQQFELLTSVVGIGAICARTLLCATGGLQHFDNPGQLIKFAGLAPASHQSGCSIHTKGRINRSGHSQLRAVLYMAAQSAKRFNGACKELYVRLRAAGKAHKQAMIAVMCKLLRQSFGVFKAKQPFDNQLFLKFQK
jgi:transposase